MSFKGYIPLSPEFGVSHRYPFHGAYIKPDVYDYDVSADDRALNELQDYYIESDIYDYDVSAEDRWLRSVRGSALDGFGLDAGEIWKMSKNPLLRGLFVGTTAYLVAKAVGAAPAVQKRVGLVSGGLEAILGAASAWLNDQILAAQTPAPPVAAQVPVATPTGETPLKPGQVIGPSPKV